MRGERGATAKSVASRSQCYRLFRFGGADAPVFARVRDLFNTWFERFASSQGAQAIKDLRRRLMAKGEGQFNPASWELYLHELFSRLGFAAKVHLSPSAGPNRISS